MAIPKLVLIPSGYKDGKVYSVLPNSGDGDFDFSRGSNATRVNKDGLIETMPLELGSEILSGLDLTSWTALGSASSVNSDGFTTTTAGGLSKTSLLTVGKDYKALISGTTTSANTQIRSGNNVTTYFNWDSSGSFSFEFTFTATDTGIYIRHSGVGTVDIVNFSVKEVLSGYDTPRLDYSDSSCPSLLLEPQRTNLIPYSEGFTNAEWVKSNLTVLGNQVISPDGTLSADKVSSNTSNSTHFLQEFLSTGNTVNVSVFVKNEDADYIQLNNPSSGGIFINFDIKNGLIGSKGSLISNEKIENYGNGWYRISATLDNTGVDNRYIRFYIVSSANAPFNQSWQPSSNISFYIWGGQAELNSFPTSYIPTNGATATRLAETANGAGNANTFNDSEGVLMIEMSALADDSTYKTITINDNSETDRIQISINANSIYESVRAGDSAQSFESSSVTDATTFSKVALKYKANDVSLWINGFETNTDSTAAMPSGLSQINFDKGDGGDDFYGSTKQLQYYNSALTDSELEELTSWESFLDMANVLNYTIK